MKINLETERIQGQGPYTIDNLNINYLTGLNDLCKKYITKDLNLLELGTYDGVSTTLFSYFANTVTGVDSTLRPKMQEVLNNSTNITFYNKSFEQFLNEHTDIYDVIYIDGNHDYNNILTDIKNFLPRVKSGGYISGHDFNTETPDVERAVKEIFNTIEVETFSDSSWIIKVK